MCGRYNLITDAQALIDAFDLINRIPWQPHYNIAPSRNVPAVRQGQEGREGFLPRWGLLPHWAKDEKFGYHTINARAETVDTKPAFRSAFRRRRCLIPATGFYEWRQLNGYKQPYHIRLQSRDLFAFAGLWERWTNPEGKAVESCTIIVTEANEAIRPIHDRMPVILPPDQYQTWLDSENRDVTGLKAMLKPYPADQMTFWPVSRRVGNPGNDDPGLVKRIDPS